MLSRKNMETSIQRSKCVSGMFVVTVFPKCNGEFLNSSVETIHKLIGGNVSSEPANEHICSYFSFRSVMAMAAQGTSRSMIAIFHFSASVLRIPAIMASTIIRSTRAIASGARTICNVSSQAPDNFFPKFAFRVARYFTEAASVSQLFMKAILCSCSIR